MLRNILAQYLWSCRVSWCLAEGYRNSHQHRPVGPCGSGMTLLLLWYLWPYYINSNDLHRHSSRSCRMRLHRLQRKLGLHRQLSLQQFSQKKILWVFQPLFEFEVCSYLSWEEYVKQYFSCSTEEQMLNVLLRNVTYNAEVCLS